MKKMWLAVLMVVVALSVLAASGVFAASPHKVPDVAKERAPALEMIEFIHWDKQASKNCVTNGYCESFENPSCPDCKNGGEEPTPTPTPEPTPTATCYGFIGQYGKTLLKWQDLPVDVLVNPTNSGYDFDALQQEILQAVQEWDGYTSASLFGQVTTTNRIWGVQDFFNVLDWGNYPTEGVIAVARVWRNPATKAIVEFDIRFDTDYTWSIVDEPSGYVMDVQNIATHELGHGLGLDDVYETECQAVTMYGKSGYRDIDKRTIELPDKIGLWELYGD